MKLELRARIHLSYFRTNTLHDNVDNTFPAHSLHNYLLVKPGSSSENVKNPLLISSVLGAKIFDVAVCGLGGDAIGDEETGDDGETTNNGSSITFANLLLFSSCTTVVSSIFDILLVLNCAAE